MQRLMVAAEIPTNLPVSELISRRYRRWSMADNAVKHSRSGRWRCAAVPANSVKNCGRVIKHAESYVCEVDGRLVVGI